MGDRTEWIVSRTLRDEDTGAEVVVGVGRPRSDDRGDWSCAFGVDGDPPQLAHGVDEFQALLLALQGLHYLLARSGRRLTWLGDAGDTGIPRLTPESFGLAFRQRIERMIDDEVERFAEQARQRCELRRDR